MGEGLYLELHMGIATASWGERCDHHKDLHAL